MNVTRDQLNQYSPCNVPFQHKRASCKTESCAVEVSAKLFCFCAVFRCQNVLLGPYCRVIDLGEMFPAFSSTSSRTEIIFERDRRFESEALVVVQTRAVSSLFLRKESTKTSLFRTSSLSHAPYLHSHEIIISHSADF